MALLEEAGDHRLDKAGLERNQHIFDEGDHNLPSACLVETESNLAPYAGRCQKTALELWHFE